MKRKIIDVHSHIYPDKIASKAAKNIGDFYEIPMDNDGTLKQMLEKADNFDVKKFVINSVATSWTQVEKINNFMIGFVSDSRFAPLATLHPDMEKQHIIDEIQRITALGLNGLKLHPDCQAFQLNGKKARILFDALGEFKKPILVHTGDKRHDFSHPSFMVDIAKDYPHLNFIAAHFGGWSEWDQLMKYKGLNNVYFDTSSTLAFLDKHIAKVSILSIGIEKFMFGTDYPMWDMADEVERVLNLELGEENNQAIFYKNANKFFNFNVD